MEGVEVLEHEPVRRHDREEGPVDRGRNQQRRREQASRRARERPSRPCAENKPAGERDQHRPLELGACQPRKTCAHARGRERRAVERDEHPEQEREPERRSLGVRKDVAEVRRRQRGRDDDRSR